MTNTKVNNFCDIENVLSNFFLKHNVIKKSISKRLFDIVFSLTVLILGSPLFLLLAILVKATSEGPAFYSSKRIGAAGRTIYCWKFRTMFKDAEQKLKDLLDSNPHLKIEWQTNFKLKNDPRITTIGKLLRKTSLDELPQFWNVLIGDLSTVGPRPLSAEEVAKVILSGHGKIFSIRPGLTGLWQTSGRSLIPFDQRIKIEEQYLERQSFLFDIILILKTVPMMLFPKGAF